MRHVDDEAGAEREAPIVRTSKTARFSSVTAMAGKPEIYLPLTDPKHDREFMRAVKQNRVLSLRQEPTSTKKDFGVVGFDEKKHTTYLVFKKPLTDFLDSRIIGINYDMLSDSPVAASRGTAPPKRVAKSAPPKKTIWNTQPVKTPLRKHKRLKPAAPEPKEFRVRLRITTVTEKDVTVKAMNKAEAKRKARDAVADRGAVRVLKVV